MVSVVIPTFNRRAVVVNAIESVLRQTFTNYEIIVIDDGSTDDTTNAMRPYLRRVQYLQQENRGASAAQNKGIELARGEWIAVLGSDDVWRPKKLELQLRTLREMGDEFDVCFTDCTFVGATRSGETLFEEAGFHASVQSGALDQPLQHVLARDLLIHPSSLLLRRRLVTGPNGFDREMVVGEDTDLLFRLCLTSKFCFVNAQLVDVNWDSPLCTDRLSSLVFEQDDRMFRSKAHMYNKWLQLLEAESDIELRQRIRKSLELLYYEWVIIKLQRHRWSDAIRLAKQLMRLGEGCCRICAVLFRRAVKRTFRQRVSRAI